MKRTQIADWSTVNVEQLKKLKPFDWRKRGLQLSNDMGNGCAGDPPGFPSYFTRCVYTRAGNSPSNAPDYVIEFEGVAYGLNFDEDKTKLWKRLPLDHPRTVAWIRSTFKHHHHCYQVPELLAQGKNWSDSMLIWPGGTLGKTPFGELKDEKWEVEYAQKNQSLDKWRPEEQSKFVADIRENNERVSRLCAEVATPANHSGTVIVRRYYPEFQPTAKLIDANFKSPGNWWEVMSERPTAENCPGQYSMTHPCNGSWCQMCGWHE